MKTTINSIIVAVAIVAVFYGAASFYSLSLDPHNWLKVIRYCFSAFSTVILIGVPFIFYHNKS